MFFFSVSAFVYMCLENLFQTDMYRTSYEKYFGRLNEC